jgi:hypothetical protein
MTSFSVMSTNVDWQLYKVSRMVGLVNMKTSINHMGLSKPSHSPNGLLDMASPTL